MTPLLAKAAICGNLTGDGCRCKAHLPHKLLKQLAPLSLLGVTLVERRMARVSTTRSADQSTAKSCSQRQRARPRVTRLTIASRITAPISETTSPIGLKSLLLMVP